MRNRPLPALAFLQACLRLEEDGSLIWRRRPTSHFAKSHVCNRWNERYADTIAGTVRAGYRRVQIDSAQYRANRIVYFMATGIDPMENDVDHRDCNSLNDHPGNLRLASRSQNIQNTGVRADNTSGIKGVAWYSRDSCWLAQTRTKGKRYSGYFKNIEDAENWIKTMRESLHGEFARHGRTA